MITNERSEESDENDKLGAVWVKNHFKMTVSWIIFEFSDQERVTIHEQLPSSYTFDKFHRNLKHTILSASIFVIKTPQ